MGYIIKIMIYNIVNFHTFFFHTIKMTLFSILFRVSLMVAGRAGRGSRVAGFKEVAGFEKVAGFERTAL